MTSTRQIVFLPLVVLLLFVFPSFPSAETDKEFKHTNIILIGATGDLAQKYLWRSLFEVFSKHYEKGKHAFSIYGCSRKSQDAGRIFMSEILLKVIICPAEDEDCKGKKKKFVESIQYHQLKSEKHYVSLASKINENIQSMYGLQGTPISPEDGRLVYLSIPPSSYTKTSMLVNQYLRPEVGRPWFRVVIEKPFGHSLESAKSLVEKLGHSFKEQEIYRIDHYLGKTVVKDILPFRYTNKELYEPLWNRQYIERVEVVMKEKLDVKDRTTFYDEVGVIRDVMQNHLMEMATVIGMDLPDNSGIIRDLLTSKINFVKQVETLSEQAVLIGQYSTYYNECASELSHVDPVLNTPTFAASVLSVNNARWRGVPFVFLSGKKLDEKFSYIRIIFKNDKFPLQQSRAKNMTRDQIVFHISSGNLLHPDMITFSQNLPKPKSQTGWRVEQSKENAFYFGESINHTYQLVPESNVDAYTSLINAVLAGQRHLFVDSRSLLASWKVWSPLLKSIGKRRPRIYQGGKKDPEWLDFRILGPRALEYIEKEVEIPILDMNIPGMGIPEMKQIPGTFRDSQLVTGITDEVILKLANDITIAAKDAVKDRGSFHLAVPGGQSPVLLFNYLSTLQQGFPWEQTHLWQVDERCVFQDQPQSNFFLISNHLLQYVPIPYLHIHPLPVDLTCEPCAESDIGDELYTSKIEKLIINSTFDYILLGVGYDGHIASLFPNQTSLTETDAYVIYSDAGPERVSPKRMTLTFPVINKARHISIIMLGQKKHELVDTLYSLEETDINLYPVLGVVPSEGGDLVWFIDHDALFGGLL